VAVVLALLAGLGYAGASVLQQRVAAAQPPELSLSPRLLLAVARRPLWLLGVGLDLVAYLLEAAALHAGSLVTVGPLLVSGLIWVLPLSTIGTGQRVTRREVVPAVVVTAGLAVFVQVGSPTGGGSTAGAGAWIAVGTVVAVLVAGLVASARRETGARRALLLGLATGVVYSFTAVLTKAAVDLLDDGVGALLSHWQLYVLVGVSIVGLVLNQSAFQAGHVAASLPVIAVANPVLSCTFGVLLFGETLGAQGGLEWTVTVVSIVAMIVGTILLAQSPLVSHEAEHVPALEV